MSGSANITLIEGQGINRFETVAVTYHDYSDDGDHILNGHENVTVVADAGNPWVNNVNWYSSLVQTGAVFATKKTSPGGFHLEIDAMTKWFNVNGTLETIVDCAVYKQPVNYA